MMIEEATTLVESKIVNSPVLGEVRYVKEDTCFFPDGIIGFEEFQHFVIVSKQGFAPFRWLLSLDDPQFLLPVVSPYFIMSDYSPRVGHAELQTVGLRHAKEADFLAVVTVNQEENRVSVNLRGPIIINPKERLAKQIILVDSQYLVRHPIHAGSKAV